MLGEEAVDELAARGRSSATLTGAAVVRQARARDEAAAVERVDDLGRVGLRGPQAAAQRAQLELAAGGGEDDEDAEAGRGEALALEVGGQAAAHSGLRAQQPVQRAVRQRVVDDQPHVGRGSYGRGRTA